MEAPTITYAAVGFLSLPLIARYYRKAIGFKRGPAHPAAAAAAQQAAPAPEPSAEQEISS